MDWSQGGQGAIGGAAMGSAILPGWGTAIGAGIGGLAGLFGGGGTDDYADQLRQLAQGYGKRQAPQMGPAAQAGASGLTRNRAGLIAQLEAQARGEGPSAARMQMQESVDRAAGAQASAAAGAGGRGVNAGAAMRNAMNNTAAVQAQGARDTATLRAQEQLNATNQLGGVIGQGIGQDQQLGMFNAGQTNDAARANMLAKLQMYGINDEATLRALLGGAGLSGPGMGTQIMAGGAQAVPGILQYMQQRGRQQPQGYSPDGMQYDGGDGLNMAQGNWAPGYGPGNGL